MNNFQMKKWADYSPRGLQINTAERFLQMVASDATAEPLFAENGFGADVIRFPAGGGVETHTHEGDHILLVLAGTGTVICDFVPHDLTPGFAYFIRGLQPHSIAAKTDLVLMAIGNNHFPADSPQRLEMVK